MKEVFGTLKVAATPSSIHSLGCWTSHHNKACTTMDFFQAFVFKSTQGEDKIEHNVGQNIPSWLPNFEPYFLRTLRPAARKALTINLLYSAITIVRLYLSRCDYAKFLQRFTSIA